MIRKNSSLDNKLKKQKMEFASEFFLSSVEGTAKRVVKQREQDELIERREEAIKCLEIEEGSEIVWPSGAISKISSITPELLIRLESWDEIDPISLSKNKKIKVR